MFKNFVLLVLSITILSWFAPQTFAEDSQWNKNWPKTVEGAVLNILSTMSDKDKSMVKNTQKDDLTKFHSGWGVRIRNRFGLWTGNQELIISACGGPCHPDDASMVIIRAVWDELQREP